MTSRWIALFATVLSLSPANTAAAAIITVTFSGTIDWIDDEAANFGGFFTLGDSFSGTLVYDTGAVRDGNPDPTLGNYDFPAPSAPSGFSVTLHGVDFASDPAGPFSIGILDSLDPGTGQGEDSLTTGTGPITVPAPVTGVGLWLFDGTASAFDSDALPTTLDLADFTPPGGGIASGAAVIFYNGTSKAWG